MNVEAKMNTEILSMVCTASFNEPVDIFTITQTLSKYIYEPDLYPALYCYNKDPKICFAIFSSGRVVSWGGKSIATVRVAFEQLVSNLSFDKKPVINVPEIRMIVAKLTLNFAIDLQKLSLNEKTVKYNPIIFPGAILKIGSQSALIFRTGKVIITNSKSSEELVQLSKYLQSLLEQYSLN